MPSFEAIVKGDRVVALVGDADAVIYLVEHVTSKHFDARAERFGLSRPSLRFRKSDGVSVGFGSGTNVQPLTETLEEKANETYRRHLASELASRVRGLSLKGLEEVQAILKREDK